MEWLRSADLAEYAPNLRGSGVHGGLMVRPSGVQSPMGKQRFFPQSIQSSNVLSVFRF